LPFNRLHGVTSQKIELFITTPVRISNSASFTLFVKQWKEQLCRSRPITQIHSPLPRAMKSGDEKKRRGKNSRIATRCTENIEIQMNKAKSRIRKKESKGKTLNKKRLAERVFRKTK
jgi:hypothetical protein